VVIVEDTEACPCEEGSMAESRRREREISLSLYLVYRRLVVFYATRVVVVDDAVSGRSSWGRGPGRRRGGEDGWREKGTPATIIGRAAEAV
jgi:hypothetical protein